VRTKAVPITHLKTDRSARRVHVLRIRLRHKDLVGDIVRHGAFTKSLERWHAAEAPIPILWSHDATQPDIGIVEQAHERPRVILRGRLDIDEPMGAAIFKRLRRRSIKSFSFGYSMITERQTKDGTNELLELDLKEVSPVHSQAPRLFL
jgi:HK97 family phage prohead protease